MLSESVRLALFDIQNNAELAREFTAGMTLPAFKEELRTYHAVRSCLEIVSEASRRLPDDLKQRHPGIEWRQIAAAGNFYRHEYAKVTPSRLWDTVRRDLAPLLTVVASELSKDNTLPASDPILGRSRRSDSAHTPACFVVGWASAHRPACNAWLRG